MNPSTPESAPQALDIAIIGAAMAGTTLALALAKRAKALGRPLRIALIEAHEQGSGHPGFDARSIAIAHGSVTELKRLGLWPLLAPLGCAINDIHISDRGHFGMTELNREGFDLPFLGEVVELEAVGQKLLAAVKDAGITIYCPDGLRELASDSDGHTLTLESGVRLRTKLLVAADGLHSRVRDCFKLPLESRDFAQCGLVANIGCDRPHGHWAWERFTDTGPLALLPMQDSAGQHRLSLVWALPPEEAERLASADEALFLSQLQRAFGSRAGKFISVGKRHVYPLKLSFMPRPIHHRCVFVGNAAQTLHPIAGQGFNLGLRDVVDLLQVLDSALVAGTDVGEHSLLHHYLELRTDDRNQTLCHIEALVRGFSNQYWPLVAGRSLGLRLLSWCPPLKAPVASRAMGWRRGKRLSENC
ncbi:2-octaprenyl-6-methoxyphenyl hydroxylase [Shewanella cyperi]|uniref:2-octaprenyl-6-methoxyphenyl hydroxylase n=1 Tax=Shewanella cyperi TaxID=2814292 RepID=UPI001A93C0C5|nr:2-octaprenyl-6-methoxyphenyl hydroxylase [Shewanella cyperi]QSX41511.1 2-octaprenyl-6-methoxyphenyl hydroxylase [Shewanella cyperi]